MPGRGPPSGKIAKPEADGNFPKHLETFLTIQINRKQRFTDLYPSDQLPTDLPFESPRQLFLSLAPCYLLLSLHPESFFPFLRPLEIQTLLWL